MGFSMDVGVPVVTVFLQGLLSFFHRVSFRLYRFIWDISQEAQSRRTVRKTRGGCLSIRFVFVIGISSAFFMMGLGVLAAGSFLNKNQAMVSRIGGILVILFGLYQLGIFGKSKLLGTEHRFWLKSSTS